MAELERLLGRRVKQWRLLSNVSQARLAAQAGVSLRALRRLETGAGSTVATLLQVIQALGQEKYLLPAPTGDGLPSVAAYCSFLVRQRASIASTPKPNIDE